MCKAKNSDQRERKTERERERERQRETERDRQTDYMSLPTASRRFCARVTRNQVAFLVMILTEKASYTCAAVSTGRQWHHYVGQANPYL